MDELKGRASQIRFEINRLECEIRNLENNLRGLRGQLKHTQSQCLHESVRRWPDPSGNNDIEYECTICGKDVKYETYKRSKETSCPTKSVGPPEAET